MNLTSEIVLLFIAVATFVSGFWWRIESRIKSLDDKLTKHQLAVAEKYASTEHLGKVEDRLVRAIDKLNAKIDVFPEQLSKAVTAAIEASRHN